MNFLFIFLFVYILFVFIIVVLGYFVQRMRENTYSGDSEDHIDPSSLCVIIPFRNEEGRIRSLLDSIEKLDYLPKEFVFVNDHSSDQGTELIKTLSNQIPFRILNLPEGIQGKKAGIRYAISNSESTYILTLDADVQLPKDYFLMVARLSNSDMYILPAILVAEKIHQHLYEVDLLLVNAVNTGLSGLVRPIIASGANLLFSRSAFAKMDRLESHAHMPSGDDIYLLRDFRNGKATVRLVSDPRIAVQTETPQSLKEFFHQRLRWIAKTGDVKDHLSTTLAIVQALLTFLFFGLIIYLFSVGETKVAVIGFVAKMGIDMLGFLPFINRVRRVRSWLFIPVYELIFPLYTLLILIMMYRFKPEWKGRKLDVNY